MRLIHLLLVPAFLLLLVSPTSADMDRAEWKAAEEQFKLIFSERGFLVDKKAWVKQMLDDGSSKAWRFLTDALVKETELWWGVHKELDQLAAEHGKMLTEGGNAGGYTKAQEDAILELQKKIEDLESLAREETKARDAVMDAVRQGPEALHALILKRAGPSADWPLRAAGVQVAAIDPSVPANKKYLEKALKRDKDHRVRGAALEALLAVEGEVSDLLLIDRLADPVWSVQLIAINAIRERELKRAVPHLVNALALASPRVQEALGAALQELTGENFAAYHEVWARWFEDNKEDYLDNPKPPRRGSESGDSEVEIYGLRVRSDRVLFILDISGSMKLPTQNDNPMDRWKPPPPTTGDERPPPPPPPEEILSGPKIDVAKHELRKAIEKLPSDTTFNIIAFNQAAKHWRDTMQEATQANKKEAYKWIRQLGPKGNTYIDGALRLGFRMAGLVNFDPAYPELSLDTIVLISDGAPTDNQFNAQLMDPEVILQHVREWNKHQRVVIHCIGVDLVETIDFLKKLAEENGGKYVDR